MNHPLKAKIAKIARQTGLNWVDALSLALMHYRTQTHSEIHPLPHEMPTGRPMLNPALRGLYEESSVLQYSSSAKRKAENLCKTTDSYTQINLLAGTTLSEEPGTRRRATKSCKSWRCGLHQDILKWNEPRRSGSFEVTQVTPTEVKVRDIDTWYHLNHCTKVPNREMP